jgi:hypothetical protein
MSDPARPYEPLTSETPRCLRRPTGRPHVRRMTVQGHDLPSRSTATSGCCGAKNEPARAGGSARLGRRIFDEVMRGSA